MRHYGDLLIVGGLHYTLLERGIPDYERVVDCSLVLYRSAGRIVRTNLQINCVMFALKVKMLYTLYTYTLILHIIK